jgi:lipoate-protein ligase A
VVIGRNQNPFNEINMKYAKEHHIPILRRISGGGTVYHDLGNINFTFITGKLHERLNNYRFFIEPIIHILERIGIQARFVESSHIYIGETKISGNAQSFFKDKMMHHGTLLFDSDLTHLQNVIKQANTFETHAVASTKADTINIKSLLQVDASIEEFMQFILESMIVDYGPSSILELTPEDVKQVEIIQEKKYQNWDWNIGETPEFWVNKQIDGEIIQMRIQKGIIKESSFYPEEIEGLSFDIDELLQVLPKSTHPKIKQLF